MSYGQCIAPGCQSTGIRGPLQRVSAVSTFHYLCPSFPTPIGFVHEKCRNRIRKATVEKRNELWQQFEAESAAAAVEVDSSDAESTASLLEVAVDVPVVASTLTASVVPHFHPAFDHPNFWRTHPQRYRAPIGIRSLLPYMNPMHTLVLPIDVTIDDINIAPTAAPSTTLLTESIIISSSSSSSSPPPQRGEKRKRSPSPPSLSLLVDSLVAASCHQHSRQQIGEIHQAPDYEKDQEQQIKEEDQPLSSPTVIDRPTVKEWALQSSLHLQEAVFDEFTLAYESGESEVLKIYCHQPFEANRSMRFIAKHYHSAEMYLQETRIFTHLLYSNEHDLQIVNRFIRQRLKPPTSLQVSFATALYSQFGVDTLDYGKLKSKKDLPTKKVYHRSNGRAAVAAATADLPPLDLEVQAKQHFNQLKTLVACFSFYRGVMVDAICRRCEGYPIDVEGERRRVDLRLALFWHPRSNDLNHGDYSEMMNKSLRFVLHCLEGLAMHHRSHVLIGDIKPSNLFYGAQLARNLHSADFSPLPLFGDYGHATNLTKENSSHVLAKVCSSSMKGQVKDNHIGTWPYQAPETRSVGCVAGIFDCSSDLFALALTILEILIGTSFHKAHVRSMTERYNYACKNVSGQSDSQFYLDAQEWISSLKNLWSNSFAASNAHVFVDELSQLKWNEQRTALVPSAIADLLLQMLHTDRNKRPTVQAAIDQVRAFVRIA